METINKKILIWIIAVILLVGTVNATLDTDTVRVYYAHNNITGTTDTDSKNVINGTVNGNVAVVAGKINNSYTFDGDNDYVQLGDTPILGTQEFSISAWIKTSTTGTTQQIIGFGACASAGQGGALFIGSDNKVTFSVCGVGGEISNITVTNGTWVHVGVRYVGTTQQVFVNGLPSGSSGVYAYNFVDGATPSIGSAYNSILVQEFTGEIDEVAVFNTSLSNQDFLDLYNNGVGLAYPFISGGGSTDIDFSITDDWNGSSINSFSVNITWANTTEETYSTINGSVTLTDVGNPGSLDVTFWNITNYFDRTLIGETITENNTNNIATTTYQAEICFNASSKVSGVLVTPNNFTIGSTVRTSCFNLSAGTYNVTANKTGWYTTNQNFTIVPLQNSTETVENMSYANLTVSAKDGTTNATLTNYNLTIKSLNFTLWAGEIAGPVTNHSFYLINGTYNVTIDAPGYELTNAQANVTVNGNTNYTFTLFKENSITINIFDEITNAPILTNITARFTNNITTWENTTATSHLFIYNVTPSIYTILFYGSGYSTRTYTVTVGNRTTQTLNAYMISSNYSTTFTVKDVDSGDTLSNVSISMYKQINSTWSVVESKFSDISGRALFYYDPIGSYKFYLSLPEYNDYVFFLNPILFSSYDVYMSQTSLLNATQDYDGVAVIYAPDYFANNENTTFNFIISSPDGLLTEYGINLTYPGGSVTNTGVNAIGSQLSEWVNITNATAYDRVRLDYYYISSTTGRHDFVAYFPIAFNISAADNTFLSNKNKTYGLGIFERILIVTLIVLFIVGIGTLVGQPIPSMALGLFCFGYMAFIGFVPLWAILPSMFIGILFLVWKSGGY